MSYLFESDRLGFRTWEDSDLEQLYAICSNPAVMRYFPKILERDEIIEYIRRMTRMQREKGYCYFPVERLIDNQFIGFIGLAYQDYEAPFTPGVDIGWRLAENFWGKGYASEGAKACLLYAFNTLKLEEVFSVAPVVNRPSINVMERIGMRHQYNFNHPKLTDSPTLENCSYYTIRR